MFGLTFLLSACGSSSKNADPAIIKDGAEQVLVDEGQSSQATYSPHNNRLLFVSSARRGHKHAQIYEKDLDTGVERRITFQNGSTMYPRYHPKDNLIMYASSTDELKENPPLLNPTPSVSKLPAPYQDPFEIYLHQLDGLAIHRMTQHPGFDGEARFSNNGREVVWTHTEKDRTLVLAFNIAQWDREANKPIAARIVADLGKNPTQYMIAPNSQATAWVDWDETYGIAKLMAKKGSAKAVEINDDKIVRKTDLAFSPDSMWLLWSQHNPSLDAYELWAMDTATLCARPIVIPGVKPSSIHRRYPAISPDMKWLTYTWSLKDRSRIMRVPFKPGKCVGEK